MDETHTIAALIARIDFLETRVVALEAVAFPVVQTPVRTTWTLRFGEKKPT